MPTARPPLPAAARRLRAFRRRRKWTMTQAADWYGVSLAAWSRWESGARPIPGHLRQRLKAER